MKKFKATYKGEAVMVLQILEPVTVDDDIEVVLVDAHNVLQVRTLSWDSFTDCEVWG